MATPAPNTKAFWIQNLFKQVPDCDAKPAELEKLTLHQLKIFCVKQGLNLTETVQLYHREKGRAKRAAAEAEAKAAGTEATDKQRDSAKSASSLTSLNLKPEFDDWSPTEAAALRGEGVQVSEEIEVPLSGEAAGFGGYSGYGCTSIEIKVPQGGFSYPSKLVMVFTVRVK